MSKFATNRPDLVPRLLPISKMPAFILYGSRGSTNTDRVRLTLAEGGFMNYKLVLLDLQKGEQKASAQDLFKVDAMPSKRVVYR
jgi:glutathione S-transferase